MAAGVCQRMVHLKGLVTGAMTVVVALAFIGFGAYMVVPHYQQTSGAESVDATVVESAVVETRDANQNREYYPTVTYEYTYHGETYTSESIFPGGERSTPRGRANEIVGNYSAGSEVTAYVVSEQPDESYLIDEGVPWWFYVLPVVGLVALKLGIAKTRKAVRGETGPAQVELF